MITVPPRRLYAAVAACALVVHLGALWNRFAFDDIYLIVLNDLVHHPSGIWRAFGEPYLSGLLYRPLAVAGFALDWSIAGDHAWWYHLVNLLWHAGAAAAVAALAYRWAGAQEEG
ncbi:MAG: hypothetical protein ACREL9_13515, partial [Gemmatimonadales bacterium]